RAHFAQPCMGRKVRQWFQAAIFWLVCPLDVLATRQPIRFELSTIPEPLALKPLQKGPPGDRAQGCSANVPTTLPLGGDKRHEQDADSKEQPGGFLASAQAWCLLGFQMNGIPQQPGAYAERYVLHLSAKECCRPQRKQQTDGYAGVQGGLLSSSRRS